ncbi:terminase small subunit [Neotabrizicola sp. VNH66]|uniref:terminase small subunit n=1 Tax=Neotabrizicola sp. VNH66 TaxID=3400918 RepID=UPI003C070AED
MSERDPITGQFAPGNKFWAQRSSFGPAPKFANGDELYAACLEYFEWAHDNPLYADQLVTFQGSATHEPVAKMRAMTITGLCLFLDISDECWRGWRTEGHARYRPDLVEAIAKAEAVIWTQKFEGASADLLNPGIIARELGLIDKKQLGNDPENPLPAQQVTIFALPDNGRG